MAEQVEMWKSGMDSTLIFVSVPLYDISFVTYKPKVGLFVAIITAFQVPVSQNLSANPADLTNTILNNLTSIVYDIAVLNGLKAPAQLPQPVPFKPARSDEIVTFFWYSALILAVYYFRTFSNHF